MHRYSLPIVIVLLTALSAGPASAFDLEWGDSWDVESLQNVLDARYGPGVIDVGSEYEGYNPADAVIP